MRGGAINIGYIASSGGGASVTFNGATTFVNNYVASRGQNANNRNALGGAISVYGNNSPQNYRLQFNAAAVFRGNYVYSQTGFGHGGAIYYDTGSAGLNLAGGTIFEDNYAKTHGGAIYLQAGVINLNADDGDITFQGNRHGADFDANTYRPTSGSGTPNAIYLGSGGALNFVTDAGRTIHFHDPIASITGSQVTVTKSGAGEVIFYGDNGETDLYNSNIQANTTVSGGLFTLADGVEYGSANFGTFTVQNSGTVRGGGGGALNANSLVVQNGGALGASGGVFTVNASSATLAGGARLTGFGTLASASTLATTGIVTADIEAGQTLGVTAQLAGAGGINKTGGGTLTLAAANTYSGATTVTTGTLAGGVDNAFASSSSVTVESGGTLDTNGFSQTAANLSGSGAIRLTGADLAAVMGSNQEFSGVISGTGGFNKTGSGTLTLSGDNSYIGTTSITGGTLRATQGTSLGTGLVLTLIGTKLDLDYTGDQVFANRLAGDGVLVKNGTGTAHVTGGGSRIDAVTVSAGEFSLEQQGVFWTDHYQTMQNATTSIASGSKLYAAESFIQDANSTLNVQIGNNEPAITGISASIDGNLNVTGFTSGPLASASQLRDVEYTIIRTTSGITGDFAVAAVDDSGVTADYLTITGGLTNGGLEYAVGLGLTWYATDTAFADGTFTLTSANDAFDVDIALSNRGPMASGWNGNSLEKLGLGTLTLSAQNTYTGITDIQEGTLAAGAVGVLENSSDITVATGATLDLNGFNQTVNNLSGGGSIVLDGAELTAVYNANLSIAGSISGGGTLVKDGASALTLSGTNSHGDTVVRQGSIIATTATALGAGTVDIGTTAQVDLALASTGVVANQFSGGGTLRNTGAGVTTLTGIGAGVGAVDVAAGELAYGQNGVFEAGTYRTRTGAATSIGETATLSVGGAFVQEANSRLNVAIGQNNEPAITADSAQLAGTLTITGFEADMFRAASRFGDTLYDVVHTTQAMTSGFDVVDIGTVIDPVDYLTVGGFLREGNIIYSVGFSLTWYTGPTTGHGTFTIADGNVFDVDVDLADQTGPFDSGWNGTDLTKRGNGTLILSSVAKSYSGNTTVEAGTLATSVNNAFDASTSVDVQSGGTLALQGTTQTAQNLEGDGVIRLGGGRLNLANSTTNTEFSGTISDAGSVSKSGNGEVTLSGNNTYTGGTAVTGGTLVAASASALGTGAVSVAQNATLRLDVGGDASFANALSGQGSLEKIGGDTLRLTNAGSSIGEVRVVDGGLTLAQSGRFTAGTYTTQNGATTTLESGAQLSVTGQFTQADTASLVVAVGTANNPAVRAGSATIDGNLDVTGFNADVFARSAALPSELYTVIASGTAIVGDFDTVTIDSTSPVNYLTLSGTFNNNRTEYYVGLGLTWNAATDVADGEFEVDGNFVVDTVLRDRSGEAITSGWDGQSLTKSGSGTLTLAAANTYQGTTTVSDGTLVLRTNNTIQYSSAVSVAANATLQLNGQVQTANNLAGGGTVALGGTILRSAYSGPAKEFSGQMNGTGQFIKSGAGELTLSGTNTHSGGTTVSDGQVNVTNYAALGSGLVQLKNPGRLNLALDEDGQIANRLFGNGQLLKTGAGITTVTSANSSVGAVDVRAGTLALAQNGGFSATDFTIRGNAATSISGNSDLNLSGNYLMEANSTLSVTVGASNQPAISANSATLNGTLNITGFRTDPLSRANIAPSALALTSNSYEVVRSNTAIIDDFTTLNIGTVVDPVNYLTLEHAFNSTRTSYFITFGLTWYASEATANGTFNLVDASDRFVVDVDLANRLNITSGWDGQSLTKAGDGTLVLALGNSYSGDTLVHSGTLSAGVNNAFVNSRMVQVDGGAVLALNGFIQTAKNLTGAGAITLGGGTLTTEANTPSGSTFTGTISGNGSVRKTGDEILTLSGQNTYTGTTVIDAGTLRITNGDALARGDVQLGNGTNLDLAFAGDETLSNRFSGTGSLTKTDIGIGHLTGSGSSVGAVSVQAGTLSFEQNSVFNAASLTTAAGATTNIGPQSQLRLSGEMVQGSGSSLSVTTSADNEPVIHADRATLDGELRISGFRSETYEQASTLPTTAFTIIETVNGIVGDFSNVVIDQTIDPIDYLSITSGVVNKNYEVGVQLTWNAVGEAGNGVFTITGTDTFNVDVQLTDRTGSVANNWNGRDLTKSGTGTLILSSSDNDYSGSTNITAGTLRTGANNVFASSSGVNIDAGALLDLAGFNQIAQRLSGEGTILTGGGTLAVGNADDSVFGGSISGGGSLIKTGSGSLTLSGESDYSGGTTLQGGTLVLQNGAAAGTGGINVGNGTVLQLDIAATQNHTFNNVLSGSGALMKTGSGTAELTANGSNIGPVSVQEGTLALRQDGALTTDNFETRNGATTDIGAYSNLVVDGVFTQADGSTLHVAIGSNEPAVTAGSAVLGGNLVITGFDTSTYSSASSILDRNFVVIDSGATITSTFDTVTIANNGVDVDYLTVNGRINFDDNTQYIVGFNLRWYANDTTANGLFTLASEGDVFTVDRALNTVSQNPTLGWDGNSLTKAGDGTLILSAQNGYTGSTTVSAGTLLMGTENAIQRSELLSVANGATFNLNGIDQIVKGISGDGSILLGDGTLSVGSNFSGSSSSTFDGTISGSGGINKTGDLDLTLTGVSDYTGGTTINGGTLILQNGSAAGTGGIDSVGGTVLQLDINTDQTFVNTLSGAGELNKTGTGTATLTGQNSVIGNVDVQTGSITLAQDNAFTADNYTIAADAGTSIAANANLVVNGTFTKDAAGSLAVAIGMEPSISANSAVIGGTLSISGFDTALPASALTAKRHTVLQTGANGITGDFSSVNFGGQATGVDYLVLNGELNSTNDAYTVGFDLAWYAGMAEGTGSFTMNDANNIFDVDVLLEDRNGPFASTWNGRSLTKNGDGTLILSYVDGNTYSGATEVNGGVLDLRADNALGRTSSLAVADGATVRLNDKTQTVGSIDSEAGSVIDMGNGALVVDTSRREDNGRDNVINGILQGEGSLDLRNADLVAGGASANYTGDVIAQGGSAITLNHAQGLGSAGALVLTDNSDSLEFASEAQTGVFGKDLSGEGAVALRDGTDITFSGTNTGYDGGFTVDSGATMRAGAAENLGTADIQVDGTLRLSSSSAWTLGNTVTGDGDFIKDGTGSLNIESSMAGFSGNSRVAAGALVVGDDAAGGAVLGGPLVEVDAGASLSGTGRVDGQVVNRGVIASLNALPGYGSASASNLNIGQLVNEGTLRLAGTSVGNTLTVRDGMVSQEGLLEINTVFGDDSSPTDKLILDGGATTGTTGVIVHNRGGMGAQTDVGIMVVEAMNGATTSPGSFALSALARNYRLGTGTLAAGAFDYSLVRGGNGGDENSWYLVSQEGIRPEAGNYLVNREAAESLFFHTMYDRLLGYQEYRDPATGERHLGAAWARIQYGRSTQDYCLPGQHSTVKTFTVQTGMDLWRAESAHGVFSAGAMIGFGTARGTINCDATSMSAKSNLNGYMVGGYATWFMDRQRADGLYVDSWFQHAWFRNNTSGDGLPGEKFNTRLWSGSLEAGYAFPLFRTTNTAWSVVPTVQLTYKDYKANDFVEVTGTEIKHHDSDRFMTRAGFRLKGDIAGTSRLPAQPYAEFNWLYKGQSSAMSMDQHRLSLDSPRHLYEAKLGVEAAVRSNVHLGIGLSAQLGKQNYRRYSGEIGLRVEW
ncbi:MAG: autotransporter-associated beta strand repeat-containing protein [Planctomycetaceae bacterium]|nr:autotransporter-associated beta strand repeat-containing protein [Planctomycetaceae bacterium]